MTRHEQRRVPQDVLIATLYNVGSGITLVDDERLAKIFDAGAQDFPGTFRRFRMHPLYEYSRVLSEALQRLDLGGSIVRDNAPLQYFRVSPHVLGDYGKAKFESLDEQARDAVQAVAEKIRQEFKD